MLLRDEADDRIRRAASAIESYLSLHPQAADSEVGIAQFWLREDNDVPMSDVRRALDLLIQQGRVRRDTLPDGTVIYRAGRPHP